VNIIIVVFILPGSVNIIIVIFIQSIMREKDILWGSFLLGYIIAYILGRAGTRVGHKVCGLRALRGHGFDSQQRNLYFPLLGEFPLFVV
jgi:uncharacterized RDD family membrane protein YckC